MRIDVVVLAACLGIPGAALAKEAPLTDLQAFIRDADRCEQLAVEWNSDLSAKKKKEIERAIRRYCAAAQKQLKAVTLKYQGEAEAQKQIAEHTYDSVKYFTR